MSATERLLTNIREYTDLLQFLDQKYPKVLNEFKIINAGLPGQQETNDKIAGVSHNHEYTP